MRIQGCFLSVVAIVDQCQKTVKFWEFRTAFRVVTLDSTFDDECSCFSLLLKFLFVPCCCLLGILWLGGSGPSRSQRSVAS